MINVRKSMYIILVIIICILSGCTTKESDERKNIDLYDLEKGKGIANDYFKYICKDDIESANSLCSEELLKANKNIDQGISKITSYQMDKVIGGNDFSYFIFNVIRTSTVEPKSDLETYTIKVMREDQNYSIDDIKAKSQKELFIKNNSLRIVGEDGGKSSLIINLNNFPKDAYSRENKIMLYKDKVPTESFGKVVLGFSGEKVAITTKDNNTTYISVAVIDDSLMELASVEASPTSSGNSTDSQMLQSVLETPIITQLIPIDLIKNIEVEKFIFSKDDGTLAVNYKNDKGVIRTKLYKSDDGSPVTTDFEKVFPEDEYNVAGSIFNGDIFKFEVKSNKNYDDNDGEYEVNLKTLQLKKL